MSDSQESGVNLMKILKFVVGIILLLAIIALTVWGVALLVKDKSKEGSGGETADKGESAGPKEKRGEGGAAAGSELIRTPPSEGFSYNSFRSNLTKDSKEKKKRDSSSLRERLPTKSELVESGQEAYPMD